MTDYSEDTTYERGEKWRAPLFFGSVEKPNTAIWPRISHGEWHFIQTMELEFLW